MTIKEMLFVVNALYGKKKRNLINLEKNPYKNKLTKKCKPGYFRNINFHCAKQKTRKNTRAPGKTRTSLKNKLLKNKGKTEKLSEKIVEKNSEKSKSGTVTDNTDNETKSETPGTEITSKSTASTNSTMSTDNAPAPQQNGNFFQNIFGAKNEPAVPAQPVQAQKPIPVQVPQ
jgi:hypothetical protein